MKPFFAESFFICFGSQENHWLTLRSFTHCSQMLLWAFPDFTLTDLPDTQANGCTKSWFPYCRKLFLSLTVLMYFSNSLKGSHFIHLEFHLPHPMTWPNNLCYKILCLLFLRISVRFKRCPVLGKMNLGVLSSSREQRDHQLHLLSKTSCDSPSFDPFEAPLNAAVERGPEGLYPQMIKKWIIGLFIVLLKPKVHY